MFDPPIDTPLNQVLMDLPEELITEESEESDIPRYRPGALLEWMVNPSQMQAQYKVLNEKVIDAVIPTRFIDDSSKVPNFFTLWEITDELKKTLGTPILMIRIYQLLLLSKIFILLFVLLPR